MVYGGFLPRVAANKSFVQEQLRRLRVAAPQTDFWIQGTDGEVGAPSEDMLLKLDLSEFALELLDAKGS